MAIRYYSVTRRGASDKVRHGFDGVGDAIDEAVDAALAQEDIDASEGAEEAVEAIRAAADTAIAAQSGDVVVLFDDSVITRRDHLRRALEAVLRTLEGSDALSS